MAPKVIDSSGIINARDRELEGSFLAPPSIASELKDIQSRLKFEGAVASGAIKLRQPDKKSLDEVWAAASKSGTLSLLSETDLEVLALASEEKLPLVTDDYDLQNMCTILGLKFERVSMRGIRGALTWKKKCAACGKAYKGDASECEACGSTRFKVVKGK